MEQGPRRREAPRRGQGVRGPGRRRHGVPVQRLTGTVAASLTCDGRVVASLRRADTFRTRLRGLIGTADPDGALLLTRTSSVHGIGVRYPLDVAFLDDDLHVLATTTLRPMGFARSRARGVRHVLEARAGAFAAWGLEAGARLGAAP